MILIAIGKTQNSGKEQMVKFGERFCVQILGTGFQSLCYELLETVILLDGSWIFLRGWVARP